MLDELLAADVVAVVFCCFLKWQALPNILVRREITYLVYWGFLAQRRAFGRELGGSKVCNVSTAATGQL